MQVMITGPFRGANHWETENNIRRVEDLAAKVIALGAMPIMLHTMYRFLCGAAPDEFFLNAGLDLLKKSDVLLMEKHWANSERSVRERNACRASGKPVFYSFEDLRSWFKEQGSQAEQGSHEV